MFFTVQGQQVKTSQEISNSYEKTCSLFTRRKFTNADGQSHEQSLFDFDEVYVSAADIAASPRLVSHTQRYSLTSCDEGNPRLK